MWRALCNDRVAEVVLSRFLWRWWCFPFDISLRKESWRIEDAVVDPVLLLLFDVEEGTGEEEGAVVVEVDRAG